MNGHKDILDEIKEATYKNPSDSQMYDRWRQAILELENAGNELEEYQMAIEKYLDTSDAYNSFGSLLTNLEKYEEAIIQYKKAIEKDKINKSAYFKWGETLEMLGRYEEAIEQYKKVLEIDPNYIEAFNAWGGALANLGQHKEAIIQYKKAIEKDPEFNLAYINWGRAIANLQNPEKELEDYRMAVEKNLNTPDGYNRLGNLLYDLKKYEKAIIQYKKAIEKDSKNKNAYFNWGVALQNIGQYQEAIGKYNKASEMDKNDPYPLHNIALILEKQGYYLLAKSQWAKACSAYETSKEIPHSGQDADYFLYYGSIYHYSSIKNIDKAEEIYEEGLKVDPNHTTILLNLVRLCLERKSDPVRLKINGEDRIVKTQDHCRAWEYFRSATRILEDRLKKKLNINTLLELGKLYLAIEDYSKSKDYLLKVVEKDAYHKSALSDLGTVFLRQENYRDAISYYKAALDLDPDDLDLRSNLAEAYLKAQINEKAEMEYRKVLDITSDHHMDSLIGIGETYTAMGEDARKRNDSGEAEEMFTRALKYCSNALRLVDYPDHASKLLNTREFSALFYSKGYAQVMSYETQKRKDGRLLESAKQDFKKVEEDTANFYKAQRAAQKIHERLNPPQGRIDKWGPRFILFLSAIVFFLAQWLIFIGKPVFGRSAYSINKERLDHVLAAHEFDAQVKDRLNSMAKENLKFYSLDHFSAEMKKEFGDKVTAELDKTNLLAGSGGITLERFQPLDPGYYALLTFGSFIFMIAGLYLSQITKLKVGAIELEKSTVDQITISSTLGITK